ncbi:rhodanese-like domain-containing protein [Alysiella filiformis]|uniref:Phage shock protein E n=1 Tax=Alysiella filiformis DSM 16848 TaxID=1120981 RepID=A0A286ERT2_9NEIS|nr:rhodanese-like domain-containing protein [Alysiella filiformis]QMT31732.1 rhodanese-like domain-containing protein [Alysiella filiformis]UBQ55256.1 rhodanese-like domain-containing protein [Alysiella filiformis DSM 16848]SOD73641.1 phage shock protein E [Alysiella filiformis DSM 16848]
MKKYLPLLILAALSACSPAEKPATQTIAPSQSVAPNANKKVVLIDVRTADEFKDGHLADATNIPHDQIAQRIAETGADKDSEIHLYCRSGNRSEQALQTLKGMGFTNVKNLGAYQDLIKQK